MKIAPVVIIDTREQNPWEFSNLPSESGSLSTGDYSVRGLTHLIAVERKSLPDLLACVGRERDRFKRELQRLRAYRFCCLIIETDYKTLELGEWRSKIKPASVLGSLAAWQAQYSLPIWLAGDHASAGRFAERYLFQCARVIADESAALGLAAIGGREVEATMCLFERRRRDPPAEPRPTLPVSGPVVHAKRRSGAG